MSVFKPTIRRGAVAIVAVVIAFVATSCQLTPEQSSVAHYLNVDRRANNRSTIGTNWTVQAKAQAWAEKLAREGTLYHSNLTDGIGDQCWRSLGENVGYGSSIQAVQAAYMASPGHRANVLNANFNAVGVGYATGKVNGQTVVFTVQVYIQAC